MFKTKETESLIFDFSDSEYFGIHSYFVFFRFLAVWLDEKNNLIHSQIVPPFTFLIRAPQKSHRLLEIPLNGKNRKFMRFFDGKGKV